MRVHQRGCRCPDDIRIVGFDIEATRYVYPSLTTIRQPLDEIGRVAVDMLIKLVNREVAEGNTYCCQENSSPGVVTNAVSHRDLSVFDPHR